MSVAACGALLAEYGIGGLPGGVLVVVAAFIWTLRGVSRITVYPDRVVLRLGPFGIVTREVPRDTALLWTFQSFLYDGLTIKREDRHLIGPFVSAHMPDRWPEAELRAAGYRYQN